MEGVNLSVDDLSLGESSSIYTQKMMLKKYAHMKSWKIHDIYVDDGWSGTNFERPGFTKMIAVPAADNPCSKCFHTIPPYLIQQIIMLVFLFLHKAADNAKKTFSRLLQQFWRPFNCILKAHWTNH